MILGINISNIDKNATPMGNWVQSWKNPGSTKDRKTWRELANAVMVGALRALGYLTVIGLIVDIFLFSQGYKKAKHEFRTCNNPLLSFKYLWEKMKNKDKEIIKLEMDNKEVNFLLDKFDAHYESKTVSPIINRVEDLRCTLEYKWLFGNDYLLKYEDQDRVMHLKIHKLNS